MGVLPAGLLSGTGFEPVKEVDRRSASSTEPLVGCSTGRAQGVGEQLPRRPAVQGEEVGMETG